MAPYEPLEDVSEYFDSIARTTLERRAFVLHLEKVLLALQAINECDRGFGTESRENRFICDCLYDFNAQDIIETSLNEHL
jgi:hypothetical protein